MGGLIRCYFVHSKLMLLFKILYAVFLMWWIPFSDGALPVLASIGIGGGAVLIMSTEIFSNGYMRIMPIKSWKMILVPYLHNSLAIIMGLSFAFLRIFIFGDGNMAELRVVFFAVGMFVTGIGIAYCWYYRQKPIILFLAFAVPIVQAYLIIGPSGVHEITLGIVRGTSIMQSGIFDYSAKWLIFIAVSVAILIASYFVSVAIYKKSDVSISIPSWWLRL